MESGNGKSNKRRIVKVLLIAFVVVGTFLAWQLTSFVGASTECKAIDGYQYLEGRIAYDSDGQALYIVRGIYSTGEGSTGGKKIILPVCGSRDPSIESVRNIFLKLDGQRIFLVSGAIGREIQKSVPLAGTPQP